MGKLSQFEYYFCLLKEGSAVPHIFSYLIRILLLEYNSSLFFSHRARICFCIKGQFRIRFMQRLDLIQEETFMVVNVCTF